MLPHQLEQRGDLILAQRALADVDHDLRAVKKIRPLAELAAQCVQQLRPGGALVELEPQPLFTALDRYQIRHGRFDHRTDVVILCSLSYHILSSVLWHRLERMVLSDGESLGS